LIHRYLAAEPETGERLTCADDEWRKHEGSRGAGPCERGEQVRQPRQEGYGDERHQPRSPHVAGLVVEQVDALTRRWVGADIGEDGNGTRHGGCGLMLPDSVAAPSEQRRLTPCSCERSAITRRS